MLNPEYAKEQLKTFYIPDWIETKVASANKLPETLKEIVFAILERDSNGQPYTDYQTRYEAKDKAFNQLNILSAEERLNIFESLFPQIYLYIESAWQLFSYSPYQIGWQRKSFRAPNKPEIHNIARCQWFNQLLSTVEGYEQDITWFAAWTPYLGYTSEALGILFAVAINSNSEQGNQVFEILLDSGRGEHEIGAMGRHVTRALLIANRADGWTFVENLLLAAQRQEGLRQTILETIDEAHPDAFRRMLRLLIEQDLTRFSATVRAVDVWFGFGWESVNNRIVKEILEQVSLFLENPAEQTAALESNNAQTVYLALWTIAFNDAVLATSSASKLLNDPIVERRFVAAHLLAQLGINEAQIALLPALNDEDLRVVATALRVLISSSIQEKDLFERLERIIPNFPSKTKVLEPLVWDWMTISVSKESVASALVYNLGTRSPKRLIPYLSVCSSSDRSSIAYKLAIIQPWDAEIRQTLLSLIGDNSSWVRSQVLQNLANCTITPAEAIELEGLLTRKSGDLRRGLLQLLLNQSDTDAKSSAQRLLNANLLQRQAGLELLCQMVAKNRLVAESRTLAQKYQLQHPKQTDTEKQLLDTILADSQEVLTLDNALGLLDPSQRTAPKLGDVTQPRLFATPAAQACLESLDELIHTHRQTPIITESYQTTQEELLGNISYGFPDPNFTKPLEEDIKLLPLREVWETWWQENLSQSYDEGNLELLQILASLGQYNKSNFSDELRWKKAYKTLFIDTEKLRYPNIVQAICYWSMRSHPLPSTVVDFLLDAVTTSFKLVFQGVFVQNFNFDRNDWRYSGSLYSWFSLNQYHRSFFALDWNNAQQTRFWQLLRWLDEPEPTPQARRYRPALEDVLMAFSIGAATEADLIDQVLGSGIEYFRDLGQITGRKLPPNLAQYPILLEIGDRIAKRIIEIELKRGELPTVASEPALALRSLPGINNVVSLLQAFNKNKLVRGWSYDTSGKARVFSHLIRISFPKDGETPQDFATQVKAANIGQQQLIELAIYAPQWANYVESALKWRSFAQAVWWIHAHTKDDNWQVEQEIRETWNAQISEQTPLTGQDLLNGAVDIDWFTRVYQALKAERWEALDNAAQYASGGSGHKRAQLFADAMLGKVEKVELVNRVTQKRNQDALRVLGLLPLAKGKKRDKDLLERYQIIQEFLRTSRQFGSQRQASEKLAVSIALENLARNAGYTDPMRLQWAMEAQAIADLVKQPQTVAIEDLVVALAIEQGQPKITITNNSKPLKAIPAKYKKEQSIVQLQERKQDITRQASRMRLSLEQAMCRGDRFTAEELQQLCTHPVLAPMLEKLVFIGENVIGYPVQQGRFLQSYDRGLTPTGNISLRIAHPYDLLGTNLWHLWQQDCFQNQRQQPFKQVFRELYILTTTERSDRTISHRYAGHQVNSRQALALLGQRGWISQPEEGVRRTFHEFDLSVWLTFVDGYFSPTEVEGLTIEGVQFTRRGEWKPLELNQVSPLVFSEVMRDLDLVVSVAHQGGVDPEATASTVEMRSALLRETCRLLQITNVKLENSHALIEGHLGSYSVHLGSAGVHRQPGGYLCIVPVHSQHRDRIFLPFADNDPKTAEVISKVLLLSRDREIKDPTILEQILARG
ncbi:DUF5724 domain-containing protein [Synechocystis sp. PCC 7509]|uniref:DUF5724 domain-containing protein n=1 Tax=Synechocystis sp. PCC 7509 TaxID=927677 RepID=UPI0002ABDFED|nr:DUF5724 domain-containing protein [Synechocystis sp. PCC 7509]